MINPVSRRQVVERFNVPRFIVPRLLWNDCCGTIYYGTFYYGTIAFAPSPSAIFIVSETACIPFIYSLYLHIPLYYPTMPRIHCIKYRYQGFVRFVNLVQCIRGYRLEVTNGCMGAPKQLS